MLLASRHSLLSLLEVAKAVKAHDRALVRVAEGLDGALRAAVRAIGSILSYCGAQSTARPTRYATRLIPARSRQFIRVPVGMPSSETTPPSNLPGSPERPNMLDGPNVQPGFLASHWSSVSP